ncbi:MAG: roadblock/LC7 domain-containing protein [Chitinispirillales bacterium]|jgi:predicted regulator of Ras-like GTPase activity (Roadblock/LC7/MglB family)|nr:roadblock/LC7 domain-containing protein [Chitinispirillales bacterium]
MKDMIIFPEDIERLNGVLLPLIQKANLLLAVLINKDGRMLTSQGTLESVDIVSLAALIAGNSASTQAIATLVGETEFNSMYHQGKDKHIYIANVDDETFLSIVFDSRTNIDRVKVFVRQFERQLKEALTQVYNKSEDQVDLDFDFNLPRPQTAAPAAQKPQAASSDEVFYIDMGKK